MRPAVGLVPLMAEFSMVTPVVWRRLTPKVPLVVMRSSLR